MARKVRLWIQAAVSKHPGALRRAAKKAGALKDNISKSWLAVQAKKKGRRGKQARLAITLSRMKKR